VIAIAETNQGLTYVLIIINELRQIHTAYMKSRPCTPKILLLAGSLREMTYNKTRHVIFFSLIFCLNILLATVNTVLAAGSVFEYPRDANYVVIEYSQAQDMIIDADPIPLLRIFGDGRVLVHYPVYMKRAGDYEMRLSDVQLQLLLSSLELKGILTFNLNKVLELKKQSENKLRLLASNKIQTIRSDDARSKFKVKLTSYQPATSNVTQADFLKSIHWKNLKLDALSHPDVTALKDAAAAELELVKYLSHQNLVKIK